MAKHQVLESELSVAEMVALAEMFEHHGWPIFNKLLNDIRTSEIDDTLEDCTKTDAKVWQQAQGVCWMIRQILELKEEVLYAIDESKNDVAKSDI